MDKKNCTICKHWRYCKYYSKLGNEEYEITEIIEQISDKEELSEADYENIRKDVGRLIGKHCRFFEEEE